MLPTFPHLGLCIFNKSNVHHSFPSLHVAKHLFLTMLSPVLTSWPSPPVLSAHPSHSGVSDQVNAAGAVGHLHHLHHHAYFLGCPGATDCGLLLYPEVLPGGLQVSGAQVGQSFPTWKLEVWNCLYLSCNNLQGPSGPGRLHTVAFALPLLRDGWGPHHHQSI